VTGPERNSEFCFPRISMFPETKSRDTLRFEGNKIHCFPRDQSLRDLLYSKTKQKQILKNALGFLRQNQATFNCTLWSRATAVNISRVTVNCFPFDVIVFAMLPAQFNCQLAVALVWNAIRVLTQTRHHLQTSHTERPVKAHLNSFRLILIVCTRSWHLLKVWKQKK